MFSPALVSIVIELGTPQSDSVTPIGRLVAHHAPHMFIFRVLMVKVSQPIDGPVVLGYKSENKIELL